MQDARNGKVDIFGAVRTGYAIVESNRLEDWKRFLVEGLGMHLAHADSDGLAFRVDSHARRLILRWGGAEDITASGLEIADSAAFDVVLKRLADRGIAVERGSDEDAAGRGVRSFVRFRGPKSIALELYCNPLRTDEPLEMLAGGFVTGTSGLGHFAITSRRPERMRQFWQEIFDARLSDEISQPMGGLTLDIAFLRLNERHHSIAIAATRGARIDPIRSRVQHMNFLVQSHADLSAAYERLRALGYAIAHEIGQHPNDRELSFYARSPSGFEIEVGWDALTVDESTWTTARHDSISIWGHQPPNHSVLNSLAVNAGNMLRGLRSLLAAEYSPF